MKRLVFITNGLLMTLLCSALSCSDTPVASDEVMNCEGERVTETLENVEAKVVDTNLGRALDSKDYDALAMYCFTISKESINNFSESSFALDDSLLVPVGGVPEKYRKVGKRVIISGYKKSCCGIIRALPNAYLLKPFGCKVELTSIRGK
jgi:hypothetical protein